MEHRNKKVKSHPITPKQKEILVEFISARKEMYTGKFTLMYTREKMVKNWEELTNILNSVPEGPAKDWKQWRKSWVDIKKNTKSRLSEQKKHMIRTGGGPPSFFPPTDLPGFEEKILNIITPVAISGNTNIAESEVVFDFENETTDFIADLSNNDMGGGNIPESTITCHSSENANTSNFVENNVHGPTEDSTNTSLVVEGNSIGGSSQKKRTNKRSRLQQSLSNNEKFLKLSEDNINSDKEYEKKNCYSWKMTQQKNGSIMRGKLRHWKLWPMPTGKLLRTSELLKI